MVVEIGTFLCGDDLLHHLHGGVVLTTIAFALRLHRHLLQHLVVGFQFDVAGTLQVGIHHHRVRHIADGTEGERPAIVTGYLVMALEVGHHTDVMTLILDTGKGNRLTCLSIHHITCNLGVRSEK